MTWLRICSVVMRVTGSKVGVGTVVLVGVGVTVGVGEGIEVDVGSKVRVGACIGAGSGPSILAAGLSIAAVPTSTISSGVISFAVFR